MCNDYGSLFPAFIFNIVQSNNILGFGPALKFRLTGI